MTRTKLTLQRPLVEIWLIGVFIRSPICDVRWDDPTPFPQDVVGLAKARAELVGEILPEHFREPLMRNAWIAVVEQIAEVGTATTEGVCMILISKGQCDDADSLMRLLEYGRLYAEGIASNGRMYAKYLRTNPEYADEL